MRASRTTSAVPDAKPVTVRFDVVNLFDKIYDFATAPASACSRAIRRPPRLLCGPFAEAVKAEKKRTKRKAAASRTRS